MDLLIEANNEIERLETRVKKLTKLVAKATKYDWVGFQAETCIPEAIVIAVCECRELYYWKW